MIFNKESLLADLRQDVLEVIFTKKDGSNRVMVCTLKKDLIPEHDPADFTEKDFTSMSHDAIVNECRDSPAKWGKALSDCLKNYEGLLLEDVFSSWFKAAIDISVETYKKQNVSPIVKVFDLQANEWRSFNINSVISVQIPTSL